MFVSSCCIVVKFNEKKIMFQSNKTRLITLLFASFWKITIFLISFGSLVWVSFYYFMWWRQSEFERNLWIFCMTHWQLNEWHMAKESYWDMHKILWVSNKIYSIKRQSGQWIQKHKNQSNKFYKWRTFQISITKRNSNTTKRSN